MLKNQSKPKLIKDLGMEYTTPTSKQKKHYGIYLCQKCNSEYKVRIDSVKHRHTIKCKHCVIKDNSTHGHSNIKLYNVWKSMIARTTQTKIKSFKNYGGRNISVCSEWKSDFMVFYKWALLNGYSDKLSIDRIDNNSNYEPNNCRFTTQSIQSSNTRKLRSTNTTGFRCVYKLRSGRWQSKIGINNCSINIGTFDYPYTAAYAYDSYVIKHKLEHTRNFNV